MVLDLEELNLWDEKMINSIISNNGSATLAPEFSYEYENILDKAQLQIGLSSILSPNDLTNKLGIDWSDTQVRSRLVFTFKQRAFSVDIDTPMVLDNGRLYLNKYYFFETQVANKLKILSQTSIASNDPLLPSYLDALFPVQAELNSQLDWQKIATATALSKALAVITGGPGTGKTQILAARIAHILNQTDVFPENILCLTYTDAGTLAMRKRLLSFIGPDAYRVQISTFHGFCNKVIQENLDYFGFKSLDAISELEQVALMRKLIDELPKNHLIKRYTDNP